MCAMDTGSFSHIDRNIFEVMNDLVAATSSRTKSPRFGNVFSLTTNLSSLSATGAQSISPGQNEEGDRCLKLSNGAVGSAILQPSKKVRFPDFPVTSNNEKLNSTSKPFDDIELSNKCFYTSSQLSEILHDLPPGHFESAMVSSMNFRYPPALAAGIQRLKMALSKDEAEISVHRQPRSALKINLEILPDHLGPSFQKWHEEGKKLLSPSTEDEDNEAGKSEESNDTAKLEPLESAEQNKLVREEKSLLEPSKVLEKEKIDGQESVVDRPVTENEYGEQNEGTEVVTITGEDSGAENDAIYPDKIVEGNNEPANDSNDACVILANSLESDPDYIAMLEDSNSSGKISSISALLEPTVGSARRKMIHQPSILRRPPGTFSILPSALNSSSSREDSPDSIVFRSLKRRHPVEHSEEFIRKCTVGGQYMKSVKMALMALGVCEKIATSLSLLALSSDFLVPTPCVFGRPHLLQVTSSTSSLNDKLVILVGDILRMRLVIPDDGLMDENREALNQLIKSCREGGIHFVKTQNVRVRTQKGFEDIASNWFDIIFSFAREMSAAYRLPVIHMPSQEIYSAVTSCARARAPFFLFSDSWTKVREPEDFAHIAANFAHLFSGIPITSRLDPRSVKPEIFSSITKANLLRDFLFSTSPCNISMIVTLPEVMEPLQILVAMTHPALIDLSCALESAHVVSFAGMGLMTYVFNRIFVHYFINKSNTNSHQISELRSMLRLMEVPKEACFYNHDAFTQLRLVHTQVADCLKILRECHPKLLIAGACLEASYRLNHSPNTATNEDQCRARLYDSPAEARKEILDLFKYKIRTVLIDLLEVLLSADTFFHAVILQDLNMFKDSGAIDTLEREGKKIMGLVLLREAIKMLHELEDENSFMKFKQLGDKLVAHKDAILAIKLYKNKLALMRGDGVLSLVHKISTQIKTFRFSVMRSRQNLSDSWWVAFDDMTADASATSSIHSFVQSLQSLFDAIEKWTRLIYNETLREIAEKMLSMIKLDVPVLPVFLLRFKICPTSPAALSIPPESKNTVEADQVVFLNVGDVPTLDLYPTMLPPPKVNKPDLQPRKSAQVSCTVGPLRPSNPETSSGTMPVPPTGNTNLVLIPNQGSRIVRIPLTRSESNLSLHSNVPQVSIAQSQNGRISILPNTGTAPPNYPVIIKPGQNIMTVGPSRGLQIRSSITNANTDPVQSSVIKPERVSATINDQDETVEAPVRFLTEPEPLQKRIVVDMTTSAQGDEIEGISEGTETRERESSDSGSSVDRRELAKKKRTSKILAHQNPSSNDVS